MKGDAVASLQRVIYGDNILLSHSSPRRVGSKE